MPTTTGGPDYRTKTFHVGVSQAQFDMITDVAAQERRTPGHLLIVAMGEYMEKHGYGELPYMPMRGGGRHRKES